MLTELAASNKVVGVKQSSRAIREGRAVKVFLASDADPALTGPIRELCARQGVLVEDEASMAQLGRACRITVGASVAAVLRQDA